MEYVFWLQDDEVHHDLAVIIDPTAVFWFPLMDRVGFGSARFRHEEEWEKIFNGFS